MWVETARWRDEWFETIEQSLGELAGVVRESRHARTGLVAVPVGTGTELAYFKLYRSSACAARLKDLFRSSRARRALVMSQRLAGDGFGVPEVLAAGEERHFGIVQRGFLLTAAVPGTGLHEVPMVLSCYRSEERLRLTRALVGAVGEEVGRFHALGYLHGDLVVTNVMVSWTPRLQVWFLDHDRTRRIGRVLRRRRQRRNLVHLNRHRLLGVHHSDRLRVLRSYSRALGWSREQLRGEARWIARKTLRVRAEQYGETGND